MTKPIKEHTLPVEQPGMPSDLLALAEHDTGKGMSFVQEDRLVPLLYVLQTNSPVVNERDAAFMQGAKPGKFWLRGDVDPFRDTIDAVFCGLADCWTEWLPGRQGFVARHACLPTDMGEQARAAGQPISLSRENGNLLQRTYEVFLLVGETPFVMPCSGTKRAFVKGWNSFFMQFRHPANGNVLPSFVHRFRLTTIAKSNAKGHWYLPSFTRLGSVSIPEFHAAKAFAEIVEKGLMRVETPIA